MESIYDPKFVETLFDRMSSSYDRMNYVTSFGFSSVWRKKCVRTIDVQNKKVIVDLLAGMGECWKPIFKAAGPQAHIIALDFSSEMIRHAEKRKQKFPGRDITLLREDVFQNSIRAGSADCVISGFGLKTFSDEQLEKLAAEIHRLLKTGGEFSLIDVSVPKNKMLRFFYLFYLKKVIPLLGRLFLGNPETYRMLGIYTDKFQNAANVLEIFKKQGFAVSYQSYFFGCASGISGKKNST